LNQTGIVFIKAASKGYAINQRSIDSMNLPYEVIDEMRIEIVKNVDI